MSTPLVTRDEIETKLRELGGRVTQQVERARPPVIAVASAGALVLLTVVYLLGRRRGRRRSTVVEIRRI